MSNIDKLSQAYKREKKPNIKEVFTDENWSIDQSIYNEKTGKYDFKISHVDGRTDEISRNRQYVDKLVKELR